MEEGPQQLLGCGLPQYMKPSVEPSIEPFMLMDLCVWESPDPMAVVAWYASYLSAQQFIDMSCPPLPVSKPPERELQSLH